MKCDKSYPCLPCVVRGEGARCEYENGVEAAGGQRAPAVDLDDYINLKARSDRLESSSQTHTATSVPHNDTTSSASLHSDDHRAADQERVFSALASLAAVSDRAGSGAIGMTGESDLFPNIVISSTVPRSYMWTRNMLHIFEAMPNKAQMDVMVSFYFSEVQVLRKS